VPGRLPKDHAIPGGPDPSPLYLIPPEPAPRPASPGRRFFCSQAVLIVPVFPSRLSRIFGTPFLCAGLCAALALFAMVPALSEAAPKGLFKTAANGQPDTLEVFVLYVQFADEGDVNHEPGTTGKGHFGTDKDISYTLDPNNLTIRRSAKYLTRRFQFAQDYFDKVSNGRVVIKPRIFPPPDQDSFVSVINYTLTERMKSYNPAIEDKSAKQKTSDFSKQRAIALMRFVSEAAHLHDDKADSLNPFHIAFT
jgi:hypothetical protein